jgi:hypothetical protein
MFQLCDYHKVRACFSVCQQSPCLTWLDAISLTSRCGRAFLTFLCAQQLRCLGRSRIAAVIVSCCLVDLAAADTTLRSMLTSVGGRTNWDARDFGGAFCVSRDLSLANIPLARSCREESDGDLIRLFERDLMVSIRTVLLVALLHCLVSEFELQMYDLPPRSSCRSRLEPGEA